MSESKISKEVLEASKSIAKHLKTTGVKTNDEIDAKVMQDVITELGKPHDIDYATFTKSQAVANQAHQALIHATHDYAVDSFGRDKELESFNLSCKLGKDKWAMTVERSRKIRIPGRDGNEATEEARANYWSSKYTPLAGNLKTSVYKELKARHR